MKKIGLYSILLILVVALAFGVVGCSGGNDTGSGTGDASGDAADEKKTPITVSSKTFTESLLLGDMLIKYLEYHGYPVIDETGLGETAIVRPALTSGEIDVYWEYTGTVLMFIMEHEPVFDSEESFRLVKEWDEKTNNIVWLDYAPVNNTYGIMVRKAFLDEHGFKNTSDMVEFIKNGGSVKFASFAEWTERTDGLPSFESTYDFTWPRKDVLEIAMGLSYDALKNNQADAGIAFTTDGRIVAYDLPLLEDDKNAFPVYNAAPTFRKEIIDTYPELPELVKELSQLLDNDTLTKLNAAVDVDGKSISEVSEAFLKEKGLIQ
ncbi:MAG: glycine betaine ABC transporter substrate-binding protein [Bacillota bacterium]|nr:glycine betaine ABC transporter substrate-binding protein [Bacillota bacterium]